MKSLATLTIAVAALTIAFSSAFAAEKKNEGPAWNVATLLQAREYAKAAEAAGKAADAATADKDYLLYLKLNALYLAGDYENALTAAETIMTQFPESKWAEKTTFRQAEAYSKLKRYQDASALYKEKVTALVSKERKERMAQTYLDFAEKYFAPKEIGTKPNYGKARAFYEFALKMQLGERKEQELRLKIGRCYYEVNDWGTAIETFKQLRKDYPESDDTFDIMYFLGMSLKKSGQSMSARSVLRDILKEFPDNERNNEVAYAIFESYGLPSPRTTIDLELGEKAAQDMVKNYPDSELTPKALYTAGRAYYSLGRTEDAVRVLEQFLKLYGGGSVETLPEAESLLGYAYLAQLKWEEARETWSAYLLHHPTDKNWTNIQRQLIELDYNRAHYLLSEEKYEDAMTAFQKFLDEHPVDQRNPGIMFVMGKILYDQKQFEEAIKKWEALASKFEGTDDASSAWFMIGQVYEFELYDFDQAMKAYEKVKSGSNVGEAKAAMRSMKQKALTISTDRIFRTNEKPVIKLTTRNIDAVTAKMYKIDLETYFRKMHTIQGIEKLDVDLISPDKTWEEKFAEHDQYREYERELEAPFKDPGVYIVNISAENLQATTIVMISDIDIIIRTTNADVLVFAENMRTEKPYANADVLVSNGSKVIGTGKTDAKGIFHMMLEDPEELSSVSVLAMADGSFASSFILQSGRTAIQRMTSHGYVFTDRPVYRPGETVHAKAFIRMVKDGAYYIDEEGEYRLTLVDSAGRTVADKKAKLDSFGALDEDIVLDATAPVGHYNLLVIGPDNTSFARSFDVMHFELPKIRLTIEPENDVVFRGELIKGKIKAEYYYGEPLKKKLIKYNIDPNNVIEGVTDEKGEFEFSFETTDFSMDQLVTLTATIPDENVTSVKPIYLSIVGYSIVLKSPRYIYAEGETFPIEIKAASPAGDPVETELTVTLYRLPEANQPRSETKIDTKTVTTDEDGKASVAFTSEKGGYYLIRAEGTDRFDNPVSGFAPVFVSGADDDRKLRILADKVTYNAGEEAQVSLLSHSEKPRLVLITHEAETIFAYDVITIEPGKSPLDIFLNDEHTPNFVLGAAMMDGGEFYVARQGFIVTKKLNVEITPPEGDVKPGDKVQVKLRATDQNGKPVSAELALAMVDEGVFSLRPDVLEGINAFFNARHRMIASRAFSSCTFSFEAVTQVIDEEMNREEQKYQASAERESRFRQQLEVITEEEAPEVLAPRRGGWNMRYPNQNAWAAGVNMDYYSEIADEGGESANGAFDQGLGEDFSPFYITPVRGDVPVESLGDLFIDGDALQPGRNILVTSAFGSGSGFGGGGGSFGATSGGTISQTGFAQHQDALFIAGGRGFPQMAPPSLLREIFEATGFWDPSIVTAEDGTAVVDIDVPDSVTSWRFSARGLTKDTLGGEATADMKVRKEFFADLKTPSFFVEGDDPVIVGTIHSSADEKITAEVELKSQTGDTSVGTKASAEIEPKGSCEVEFPLKDMKTGKTDLTLSSTGGDYADAVRREVTVNPWGIQRMAFRSGTIGANAQRKIGIDSKNDLKDLALSIVISPARDELLLSLAGQTGPYPVPLGESRCGPCVSFGASRLMCRLNALEYLDKSGSEEQRLLHRPVLFAEIESDITALVNTQMKDGGWNWAGRKQSSDVLITCDAVTALSVASSKGFESGKESLRKAIDYLANAYRNASDNETRAAILWALSYSDGADITSVNRLYRDRNSLAAVSLAQLSITLSNMDRADMAGDINQVLKSKAVVEGDMAHWAAGTEIDWLTGDVEATALAITALLKVDAADEIAAKAVNWLLEQRRWTSWGNDRGDMRASMALLEWIVKAKIAREDCTLSISVNGTQVKTIKFEGASRTAVIDVPSQILKKDGNVVDFAIEGRGAPAYSMVLSGFDPDFTDPGDIVAVERYYEPDYITFEGQRIQRGFSVLDGKYETWRNEVKELPLGGICKVSVSFRRRNYDYNRPYTASLLTMEEPIPAGCKVIEKSVRGNYMHFNILNDRIVFYFGRGYYGDVSYDLAGYAPGEYRVLPSNVSSPYREGYQDFGKRYFLKVLRRGEELTETYKKTPDELYYLGKAMFDKKMYGDSKELLSQLFTTCVLKSEPYRETARMLLEIAIAEDDSKSIVNYFEIMKEKYGELALSFDKMLRVGQAYLDMKEYEQACLVYLGIADASFLTDAQISGTLERQNEYISSADFMLALIAEYPDTNTVQNATYGLSQLLYSRASNAENIKEYKDKGITKQDLIRQAADIMERFLTLYPGNPVCDEVSFSLGTAYLELEDFVTTVDRTKEYRKRYPDSQYLDGYEYLEAYASFELKEYERALDLLKKLVTSKYPAEGGAMVESDNKDLGLYLIAQIHHSRGEIAEAVENYEKVKDQFSDAAEAIKYFRKKTIKVEEVTTLNPGDRGEIEVKFRNIDEADLRIYKIDLMKFYLMRKNLTDISRINLAGIKPLHTETLKFKYKLPYIEESKQVKLPAKDPGAYLVVVKSQEADTSGIVLIGNLDLQVEEDPQSARVRVTVLDDKTGVYENNVHVKVIGSRDSKFRSGETDLRGIFIADNVNGTATVIARKGEEYSFHRGTVQLGASVNASDEISHDRAKAMEKGSLKEEALKNVRELNRGNLMDNSEKFGKDIQTNAQYGVNVFQVK